MNGHFTLAEARATLAVLLDLAPDGLHAPLSADDLEAVQAAGVEVKDSQRGLLDFPTEVGITPAYWCWQSGEAAITWWHPQDTGFAGRRPIEDEPRH